MVWSALYVLGVLDRYYRIVKLDEIQAKFTRTIAHTVFLYLSLGCRELRAKPDACIWLRGRKGCYWTFYFPRFSSCFFENNANTCEKNPIANFKVQKEFKHYVNRIKSLLLLRIILLFVRKKMTLGIRKSKSDNYLFNDDTTDRSIWFRWSLLALFYISYFLHMLYLFSFFMRQWPSRLLEKINKTSLLGRIQLRHLVEFNRALRSAHNNAS